MGTAPASSGRKPTDGLTPVPPPIAAPPIHPIEPPPMQLERSVDESTHEDTEEGTWFRLPAWSVSLIVHVVAIVLLACIPLVKKVSIPFIIAGTSGTNEEPVPFEISNLKNDSLSLLDAALPTEVSIASVVPLEQLEPPKPAEFGQGINLAEPAMALSGRDGSLKSTLLAAYGGTPGTEDAVKAGLAWLAKQQRNDGGWSLTGPYAQGAIQENRIAATAMAVLAFAGAGNTHRSGEYQANVDKGLRFLLKEQDDDGFFSEDAPDRQQMYAQAQASIAVCELLAMTNDNELRKPAQRAVEFAEQSQGREGGWRYQPREDSDTSVTGWFVMALMSGRAAGLSTNPKVLNGVERFLDSVQSEDGTQYAYTSFSRRTPSFAMTAEALLCREYLGWKRDDLRLVEGCRMLCDQLITTEVKDRSFYYWYYATQTLHHFGGDPWRIWNESMREALPKLQTKDGKDRGSWSPQNDDHVSSGGRLYSTCFSIYCLEVYYRHLPLYGMGR